MLMEMKSIFTVYIDRNFDLFQRNWCVLARRRYLFGRKDIQIGDFVQKGFVAYF